MNHVITNKTTGMLDMSPLKDVLGRALTLRKDESREIDDETLASDIVQRVKNAGWLTVGAHAAHAEPPKAAAPPAPPAEPPAPPVEPPALPPLPHEHDVPPAPVEPPHDHDEHGHDE